MKSGPRRLLWSAAPLAIAASLLVAPAGRAMAQAIAEQLATCKKESGGLPTRIAACTWIIDKAKHNEDIRIEAHLQRGVLHERAGDKEAAIKDYSDVIALDAGNALAHFNRGNVYDQQGDHDRAIADYTQAIKIDATDADVFNNRGQSYDYKGEYALAIADYTESIRLNPKNAGAFFNRGSAYEQLGEHDRAIADYSRVDQARRQRSRGVQQPRAGLRLQGRARSGDCRLQPVDPPQPGQPPRVLQPRRGAMPTRTTTRRPIADFDEAIRLDPRDADAYQSRGAMHEELGNEAAARADYAQGAGDPARARGCAGVAGAARQLRRESRASRARALQQRKRPERELRPPNSLKREREARYFLFRASMHLRVFLL